MAVDVGKLVNSEKAYSRIIAAPDTTESNMDFKLFLEGLLFFAAGLLMVYIVRRRRPVSEEANWRRIFVLQNIPYWMTAIIGVILGIVFIIQALLS